jgi:CAP12/Pycsar effector protein, TIR domain
MDDFQKMVKSELLRAVCEAGFQPQEFLVSGLPARMQWTFDAANEVMANCEGALVLAMVRHLASDAWGSKGISSEFNNLEGGLAIAQGLPLFVIAEHGVGQRGIVYLGGNRPIVTLSQSTDRAWFKSSSFSSYFDSWCRSVRSRHKIFLGYSSAMGETGVAIREYLTSLGVSVFDWALDWRPGASIVGEVKRSVASSAASIFLFSAADDRSARENLIFELGYFARAKSLDRILLISDGGGPPGDLAGLATVSLRERSDFAAIQAHLRGFVHTRL